MRARSLLLRSVLIGAAGLGPACASSAAPAPAARQPLPGPPLGPLSSSSASTSTSTARAPALVAAPAPTASTTPTADAAPVSATDEAAATRAGNSFTMKLYARLRRTPGNLMLSGASVRQPLALAAVGARGATAHELASALEIPEDRDKAVANAKAERAAWEEARGKSELVVANRLWSDKAFVVNDDFANAATSAFGAGVEPVDFAHAPDVARRTINQWVATKTANKIPDLLAEGAVDKRSRLVVTNAVYFRARWSSPFPSSATKTEAFTTAPGRTVDVPMMHATKLHAFAHVGAVKLLAMRYDGSRLGMLVVLPDETSGLAKLEQSVTAETFETWTKSLVPQRVAVSFPRFTFTWGAPMESALAALGIKSAFSDAADFSAITGPAGSKRLRLSRVVQKTWGSVDEEGTEAAAASGITMSVTSAQTGPVAELKADHPFLFFVYDTTRARILFAGRVSNPKS